MKEHSVNINNRPEMILREIRKVNMKVDTLIMEIEHSIRNTKKVEKDKS